MNQGPIYNTVMVNQWGGDRERAKAFSPSSASEYVTGNIHLFCRWSLVFSRGSSVWLGEHAPFGNNSGFAFSRGDLVGAYAVARLGDDDCDGSQLPGDTGAVENFHL